jgi:hypothetical protein
MKTIRMLDDMANKLENLDNKVKILVNELRWWRRYGKYVTEVNNIIDAEACGYADADDEYKDNFNKNLN